MSQPDRPAQPRHATTRITPATPRPAQSPRPAAPGPVPPAPGDANLARLFREHGNRWEIADVQPGTAWIAAHRHPGGGYIQIISAHDLAALHSKMHQAEADEPAEPDPPRPATPSSAKPPSKHSSTRYASPRKDSSPCTRSPHPTPRPPARTQTRTRFAQCFIRSG